MQNQIHPVSALSSSELTSRLSSTDFSDCSVTVVGYGRMGQQFVKAMQVLGVQRICVCARSEKSLEGFTGRSGMTSVAGGFKNLHRKAGPSELAIVAVPIADLAAATMHLASLGFQRILVEKPVSLWSSEIERIADFCEERRIDATCGYNRVAYPSLQEALVRAAAEGGITSCTYTFTEFVNRLNLKSYTSNELARWGIANSLHVISMAGALIGRPETWSGYQTGSLPWHPAGRVFVGAGVTVNRIPFAYHADWGSTGRWSIEVHTAEASYRFCPLEKLSRKISPDSEWESVPIVAFAPEVKTGFVEQVAAMLDSSLRQHLPLITVRDAVSLTRFGESVFGYSSHD